MAASVVGRTKPVVVVGGRRCRDDDDANACDDDGTKANASAAVPATEEVAKMLIAVVAALENLIIGIKCYPKRGNEAKIESKRDFSLAGSRDR